MKKNLKTAEQYNAELGVGSIKIIPNKEKYKVDFSEVVKVFDKLVKEKSNNNQSCFLDSVQSKILKLQTFKPYVYEDIRGKYVETWNEQNYHSGIQWKQDDFSYSHKNVLRGLHGDYKTWKLIQCIKGRILLCVFDCNKKSKTFMQYEFFTITENNHLQVLIPPGYANGHLALVDNVIFHYKQSELYDKDSQFTIKWDSCGMKWPIKGPVLSERDEYGPFLNLMEL